MNRLLAIGLSLFAAAAMAAEWKTAVPGWSYRFPEDHVVHRDFKTEWWYFTGKVTDAKGRDFGFQVTFFRDGVRPPGSLPAGTSRFILDDVKFAHFAVTDVAAGRFFFQQKTSRGAFGESGFGPPPSLAWIEGWSLEQTPDGSFLLKAAGEGRAIDLRLRPEKGFVIHGANGVSQKADGLGHASHYYSSTRLETTGTLAVAGQPEAVTGESWFDHEWATNGLTPEQTGWNWFSIQLNDGTELMLYQIRMRTGGADPNSSGTFVLKDGKGAYLSRGDYKLEPAGFWKSTHTGATYPVAWKLTIPRLAFDLDIRTPVPDQELVLGAISYWEGLIEVQGSKAGSAVAGHGYMELTGYASPLTQMSSGAE